MNALIILALSLNERDFIKAVMGLSDEEINDLGGF